MTDKEFVLSIYPNAYFTRGKILTNVSILWEDEYGWWSKDWNDPKAIEDAWFNLAKQLRRLCLKKLEQ